MEKIKSLNKNQKIILAIVVIVIICLVGYGIFEYFDHQAYLKVRERELQEESSTKYKIQSEAEAIRCIKSARSDIEYALENTVFEISNFRGLKNISNIEFKGEKVFDKDFYYEIILKGNATGNQNNSDTPETIGFIIQGNVYKLTGEAGSIKLLDTSEPYTYMQHW